MRPEYTPGSQGFEDFFVGGLPTGTDESNSEPDDRLRLVEMDYMYMSHNGPLPMDFFANTARFQKIGLTFQYSIVLDIDSSKS